MCQSPDEICIAGFGSKIFFLEIYGVVETTTSKQLSRSRVNIVQSQEDSLNCHT